MTDDQESTSKSETTEGDNNISMDSNIWQWIVTSKLMTNDQLQTHHVLITIPIISELQRLQLYVSGKQNIINKTCLERLQASLAYRQKSQILSEV